MRPAEARAMSLIIQHEYYKEVLKPLESVRDCEIDSTEAFAEDEKIYE